MTDQLFDAIKSGDRERVAALLDADATLLAARDARGVSAISLAMYYGQPGIARLFIERCANLDIFEAAATGETARVAQWLETDPELIDAASSDGFQPLGLAAFFGHRDTVRLLLARGADVNAQARNPMQVRPIHAAVSRRDAEMVKMLLDAGADPCARQQKGYTPLHAASQNGDREIIDLLMSHGADPRAVADDGKPAMISAAEL